MALRKYQIEALEAVKTAKQKGIRRGLVVLPTGGGKTVVFSHLPGVLEMQPGEQLLILVHRDELVWQAKEKLEKYNPHLHVAIEKAQYRADADGADVIVASVQTIGRNKFCKETSTWEFSERIQRFDRDRVRYIVIDEAHHALGDSYKSVLAYFHCLKGKDDSGDKFLLGVTATPNRSDNVGLESIFDEIVYSKPLGEMIEEGWLTDIKAFRIDTTVDISSVKTSLGDFQIGDLEKTINTPARNKLIVEKYQELGENQRALAFTVDVVHSNDLSQAFNDAGITAFALTGKTPEDDRHKVIQMYRDGALRVLVSCGVLSEGFDVPAATVALMGRPTKSGLLYRQQCGRVFRPFPAPEELAALQAAGLTPEWKKPNAIVIDFCDLSGRHTLHTAPTLMGLSPKLSLKGKSLMDTTKEIESTIAQKKLPLAASEIEDLDKLKGMAQQIDLLAKPRIPEHVRKVSRFGWVETGKDQYILALADYTIIRVNQNALGHWEVAKSTRGLKTILSHHAQLNDAIHAADQNVPPDQQNLLDGNSSWRKRPVSDAQINFLWKIDFRTKAQFPNVNSFSSFIRRVFPTSGQASDRITELRAKRS